MIISCKMPTSNQYPQAHALLPSNSNKIYPCCNPGQLLGKVSQQGLLVKQEEGLYFSRVVVWRILACMGCCSLPSQDGCISCW